MQLLSETIVAAFEIIGLVKKILVRREDKVLLAEITKHERAVRKIEKSAARHQAGKRGGLSEKRANYFIQKRLDRINEIYKELNQ